jgi:Periplasmic binding protein
MYTSPLLVMQTFPLKVRRRETQHSPETPPLVVSGLRTPCPACPDRFLIFCPQITLLCDATKWGRGTADEFSKILKDNGIAIGLVERTDQGAQDMNAQLVKFKGSGADTLFVTTAVEQLSLVLKQAASLGLNLRIISTGGSQNPDQLIPTSAKPPTAPGISFSLHPGRRRRRRTPPPRRPLLQSGTAEGCHSEDLPRAFAVMMASEPSPRPSRSQARRSRRPFAPRCGRWIFSASMARSNSKRTARRDKKAGRARRTSIW